MTMIDTLQPWAGSESSPWSFPGVAGMALEGLIGAGRQIYDWVTDGGQPTMPNHYSNSLPSVPSAPMGPTMPGGACIYPTQSVSQRLPSRIDVPYTTPGGNTRFVTYFNMGRPLLWSGDKRAAARWNKCHPRRRYTRRGRR